jgi:hypothetical protein
MTRQEAFELIDEWAAEDPLDALREGLAECLSQYRLDAVAMAEPAAALVYCHDLLTPERRAWCMTAARADDLKRYFPDRLAPERRRRSRSREAGHEKDNGRRQVEHDRIHSSTGPPYSA